MQQIEFFVGLNNDKGEPIPLGVRERAVSEIDRLLRHTFRGYTRQIAQGAYKDWPIESVYRYTISHYDTRYFTANEIESIAAEMARIMNQESVLWTVDYPLAGLAKAN